MQRNVETKSIHQTHNYQNGHSCHCMLTYLRLSPFVDEHRPHISSLHATLSWAIAFNYFQLLLILFISTSDSQRSVTFGLLFFCFTSQLQVRIGLVKQCGDFRNMYPIHFQRLFIFYNWSVHIDIPWLLRGSVNCLISSEVTAGRFVISPTLLILWTRNCCLLQFDGVRKKVVINLELKF